MKEKTTTKTVSFRYTNESIVNLVKMLLSDHVNDTFLDPMTTQRYAMFDTINNTTNEALLQILEDYTQRVSSSTNEPYSLFHDAKADKIALTSILMQTELYKNNEFKHQCKGTSGLGIADKKRRSFTPVEYGGHYSGLMQILCEHYPEYDGNVRMYARKREDDDPKKIALDEFIMSNFVFVGGQYSDEKYARLIVKGP